MNKRLKIEKYFINYQATIFPTNHSEDATLADWTLVPIPQGLGDNHRIGRSVIVKDIHCKWDLRWTQEWSNNDTGGAEVFARPVRLYYILDKQPHPTVPPLPTDIWHNIPDGFMEAQDLLAFQNAENQDRFIILKEISITMQGNPLQRIVTTVPATEAYNRIDYYEEGEFHLKVPNEILTFGTDAAVTPSNWNLLIYAKTAAVEDYEEEEERIYLRTANRVTYIDH